MVSANLKGGLGNQMFQIAAAYALSKRNNDTYGFDFKKCQTKLQGNPSNHYLKSIFSKINKISDYNYKNFYLEKSHGFIKIEHKEDLLIDGYFQSEKYFIDFKNEVIKLFNISDYDTKLVTELLPVKENITSVHVRRGDYLNYPNIHPTCTLEYYKNAMNEFKNSFFIFISDDMEWVKNNFKGDNIFYSPFKDEILDLTLMTLCDNNIIANSTFSWWGAYLNKKNNKVISPKIWFGNNGPKDQFDIVPENWIKIK
jgi:hypothetical protein